jgi:hypothetical protein
MMHSADPVLIGHKKNRSRQGAAQIKTQQTQAPSW